MNDTGEHIGSTWDAWAVACAHVLVAVAYWALAGVSIVWDDNADHWGWFYQNIPTDLLRGRALESIWHAHAQPPLWNVLGAVLIKLFHPWHLQVLQALHIGLGAALAGMCVAVVRGATGSRRASLAAGAVVALHPALFLYEAYALYTTLAAFLVMLAAYFLTRADGGRRAGAVIAFVAALSTLILTRSVYHLALLALAVPAAVALIRRPSPAQVTTLLVLVLLPTAWYAKNSAQHGFFGSSSWYGMGLWRSALFGQDPKVLADLYAAGALSPVVRIPPFSAPSTYRSLGFVRTSDVPVLERDNLENVNIPAISRAYDRSAKALILHSPVRYLHNVLTAYGNFSGPSGGFPHLEANRRRMGLHARLEEWLLARPLVSALERAAGGSEYFGSIYFVLFPAVLLGYVLQLTRGAGGRHRILARATFDAAPLFVAAITAYTIAVSCAMELGENMRFKFMIEPVFIALTAIVVTRGLGRRRLPGTGTWDAEPIAPPTTPGPG